MARKKGGGHGGHGWFVTFADLMALLMSFFVMIAAYSTQDQKKLQVVAGSMRDAFGTNKESRFSGIIEQDGIPTKPNLKYVKRAPPEEGSDFTSPSSLDRRAGGLKMAGYDKSFGLAVASLRQAIQDMPDIAELSKNIIIEENKEGLNVSLVDQDGRSMFADGSVQPYERTRAVLERLAPAIRRMPNRVAVSGFTSATRPGQPSPGSPWSLSTGRAITVRDILAIHGVPDDRFASVTGKGDAEPMFPDNPYLAANRRVTITLLKEAPPVPFGKNLSSDK
jgi:chemotaxis protein MotB